MRLISPFVPTRVKAVFHFNRVVAKRVAYSLFREHSGSTDDMDIMEYATFRYDIVENGLQERRQRYGLVILCKYFRVHKP